MLTVSVVAVAVGVASGVTVGSAVAVAVGSTALLQDISPPIESAARATVARIRFMCAVFISVT